METPEQALIRLAVEIKAKTKKCPTGYARGVRLNGTSCAALYGASGLGRATVKGKIEYAKQAKRKAKRIAKQKRKSGITK